MTTSGPLACAFKPCRCTFELVQAFEYQGLLFCSERCVDGRGCDHAHCNCGKWPEAEPDE
jgi:Prokaryotic metallothionein